MALAIYLKSILYAILTEALNVHHSAATTPQESQAPVWDKFY